MRRLSDVVKLVGKAAFPVVFLMILSLNSQPLAKTGNALDLNEDLFSAVEQNNLTIVKKMINAGADVHAVNDRGYTPVEVAVDKGYFYIVQYLLRVRDTVEKNAPPSPPLGKKTTRKADVQPRQKHISQTKATQKQTAKPRSISINTNNLSLTRKKKVRPPSAVITSSMTSGNSGRPKYKPTIPLQRNEKPATNRAPGPFDVTASMPTLPIIGAIRGAKPGPERKKQEPAVSRLETAALAMPAKQATLLPKPETRLKKPVSARRFPKGFSNPKPRPDVKPKRVVKKQSRLKIASRMYGKGYPKARPARVAMASVSAPSITQPAPRAMPKPAVRIFDLAEGVNTTMPKDPVLTMGILHEEEEMPLQPPAKYIPPGSLEDVVETASASSDPSSGLSNSETGFFTKLFGKSWGRDNHDNVPRVVLDLPPLGKVVDNQL